MAQKQLVLNKKDVADLRLCFNYVRRIRAVSNDVADEKLQDEIKTQCNNIHSKILEIVDGA